MITPIYKRIKARWQKPSENYTSVAIIFHWGMIIFIIGLFPLGYIMTGISLSPNKLELYSWHKSIGILVFLITLLRFFWRLLYPPPELPKSFKFHTRTIAYLTHYLLYSCLFLIPLTGWLMSSAAGFPVVVFKFLQLPDFIEPSEDYRIILSNTHFILGICMLTLITIHISASIYHHFIKHDGILIRILPILNKSK